MEISTTPQMDYYRKLNAAFASFDFGDKVRALCEACYCTDPSVGGRPGIDPEVYVKMLLVGFLEGIPSERGIASRCADSLAIREFLGFDLTERTPHHSTLTVIRKRLDEQTYKAIFGVMLKALQAHKLVKGRRIGIDTSVIEANASLKSLQHRMTGASYWEYVRQLAGAAGIDPNDSDAVRRFDRHRTDRKTSNTEWENPHDPDARIGKSKRGATRMLHKPEHVTDLDTGAILDAEILPADQRDTDELAARIFSAEDQINAALGNEPDTALFTSVTADKGYFKVNEIVELHREGVATVISDPISNRRLDKLSSEQRASVRKARRATRSKRGKALLKRRGIHLERTFAQILHHWNTRTTTVRGQKNLSKRYQIAALACNVALLMRHLHGIGTPRQALALARRGRQALLSGIFGCFSSLLHHTHCGWVLTLVKDHRESLREPSPCATSFTSSFAH